MKRRIRATLSAWCVGAILCTSPAWSQTIIRVTTTGNDANTGADWAAAKRTVQAALTATPAGGQVWVAAGTYVERITLKNGVALYGGFAGTETDLAQRNWTTNKATLDGNQAGSVVTSPSGATPTTRIDGFTIQNGTGTVSGSFVYGGGIYCYSSSPSIANNTITANTASFEGGGVYCEYSSPAITDNTIAGNTAFSGAGIACQSSSTPTIMNNRIVGNASPAAGYGGGLYCNSSSAAMIANNTITGNIAYSGGGIACSSASPTIVNNTIAANSASSGGGIYSSSSSPSIANTIIAFNSSGVYRTGTATLTLKYNCVYENTWYNYSGLNDPTGTNGNISVDPRLVGAAYSNWHVPPDSPCVNAGDGAVVQPGWIDLDGQPRIQGPRPDIGADESDGAQPSVGPNVIVRVSPEGNDANDGSTWAAAKRTLQAGIDGASVAGGEVWVKGGTYLERVTLRACTHVYGGFGGAETARDQRNFRANVTTLDGQQAGSVVTVRTGHRFSTIDGFTIRNGRQSYGGGIYCWYASPMIANNVITACAAATGGGGISCSYASPTIANNTITRNTAAVNFFGGGIFCSWSSPVIVNSTITANTASSGGGLYFSSSSATIVNSTIVGNVASSGGAVCFSSSSSPTIANTIVAFNSSGMYKKSTGGPVFRFNCVYGNATYNYSGLTDPTGTNGNISADPGLPGWRYGNWHIRPDSPCANAGDDAVVQPGQLDIDGQTRIKDAHVDVGADESDGTEPQGGPNLIVRVSPEGDDANDGSSWAMSKRTVQSGIDAASVAGGDVWVKAGIYTERIVFRPFSHIYGGFGGAEVARDERDFRVNATVLDGQQGGSVVTLESAGHGLNTIDGFTIRNGKATNGGGVYCLLSSPRIAHNTVSGCIAQSGAGIHCDLSCATIVNDQITGNAATYDGGGIRCVSSVATIADCTITGNSATFYGGGVSCWSSSPMIADNTLVANTASQGGAVYCLASFSIIANNTIAGNTASSSGGGIYYDSSSSPAIADSIVAFNSSGICRGGFIDDRTLTYNCAYGNAAYNYSGITDPTGTNGNISTDPLFARNPSDGGDGWGAGDNDDYGDLRLTAGSPCIDAGNNASVPTDAPDLDADGDTTEPLPFDLAGKLRFVDDPAVADTGAGTAPIVDMGAYERYPDSPADFDKDGDVDLDDFAHFRDCYNGPNRTPRQLDCQDADFDGDNDVDLLDFALFRSCFNGPNQPPACQ